MKRLEFVNSVDRVICQSLLIAAQLASIVGDIPLARKNIADTLRLARRIKREGKYER